jgi:hypothetical protein
MPPAKSVPGRKKRAATVAVKRRSAKTPVKVIAVATTAFKPQPATPVIYSVHPGITMVQRWIVELKGKTGRTVEEWMKHIRAAGPGDEKQAREWLKAQYALGTNTAWWLAERAFGKSMGMVENTPASYLAAAPHYIETMYSGPRQTLRPLHDKLIELALSLGDGIRICPCKTIVPLYRKHVFAEIKPASNSRVALGFALQDEPFTARLSDTGGLAKKNRITHKVAISKLTDIDLQVRRWLKQAYELDA